MHPDHSARLGTEDANAVETAFRDRMGLLERAKRSDDGASTAEDTALAVSDATNQPTSPTQPSEQSEGQSSSDAAPSAPQINTGNSKLRRFRDKEHLRFVSAQACTVCGRQPCEPHHIRFAQPRAMSRKVSDEFTVPLCRVHHREIHRRGDEAAWWTEFGIDPMPLPFAYGSRPAAAVPGQTEAAMATLARCSSLAGSEAAALPGSLDR